MPIRSAFSTGTGSAFTRPIQPYWVNRSDAAGYAVKVLTATEPSYYSSYTNLVKMSYEGYPIWVRTLGFSPYWIDLDFFSMSLHVVGTGGVVFKLTSDGNPVWSRVLSGFSQLDEVSIDQNTRDVYVSGSADVSGTLYGAVAKLNNSGTLQWSFRMNSPGGVMQIHYSSEALALYAAGFDSNNNRAILYKVNPSNGSILWQRAISLTGTTAIAFGVGTDLAGDAYVGVRTFFGTSNITKINSSGTYQWNRSVDDSNGYTKFGLDSGGFIYASIYRNGFLKYNTSGSLIFSRSVVFGDQASTGVLGLDVYPDNTNRSIVGLKSLRAEHKLKSDGSGIGVYGDMTYSAGPGDYAGSITVSTSSVGVVSGFSSASDFGGTTSPGSYTSSLRRIGA